MKNPHTLQENLDNLYIEKAKGAFIRSRAKWLEQGEIPITSLIWKNSAVIQKKSIYKQHSYL